MLDTSELQAERQRRLRSQWARTKARSLQLLAKGDYIQDPTTGRLEGSHPGPGHGEGGGGGKDESAESKPAAESKPVSGYKPGAKTPKGGDFDVAKSVKQSWAKASPLKTIDDAKREAPKAQKLVNDAVREIAAELGLKYKDGKEKTVDQKGIDRTLEKAETRGIGGVSDLARATILVEHPSDTDKVIDALSKRFEVVAEPWKVTPEKYGDRAANLRLPNGVIAELQLLNPAMAHAKESKAKGGGGGHDLYKISRTFAPDSKTPDTEKYADAVAKQQELYGKVYEAMSDDWKAVFGKAGK
jgi:hypothetical protein